MNRTEAVNLKWILFHRLIPSIQWPESDTFRNTLFSHRLKMEHLKQMFFDSGPHITLTLSAQRPPASRALAASGLSGRRLVQGGGTFTWKMGRQCTRGLAFA